MIDKKDYYVKLLDNQIIDVPLFFKPFWLNNVCGIYNWNVAITENKGRLSGILPYYVDKRKGFSGIVMPPFTPFMGHKIFSDYTSHKNINLSFEKKTIFQLLNQLPATDFINIKLLPEIKNWLPYYWKNFQQTTRYTYVLDNIQFSKAIFNNFETSVRTVIRNSEKKITVDIKFDADALYKLHDLTFRRKHLTLPYKLEQFKQLISCCIIHNCGLQFLAKDEKGNIISTAFFIADNKTVYSILRASDPNYNAEGAMTLIIWEAISFFGNRGFCRMDFNGSMINSVEAFIRSFGAIQLPYININKENSMLYYILKNIKEYKERNKRV